MDVTTIRATPDPEKVVCETARGDYFDGFVGDVDYATLMGGVDYDEHDVKHAEEAIDVAGHERDDRVLYKQYALLDDLAGSGHWGPLEHAQITFGIKGISRVTMAQITRHRHVSFDVQSMRYVDFSEKDEPYAVPASIEEEDHFSRETGRVELEDVDEEWVEESYRDFCDEAFDWYERMVDHGMPKEDARFILPLGSLVNMSASMNARMFLHVEDMRGKGGGDAQWEIRQMTEMLREEFEEWMPMTAHIYDRRGPHKLAP